MKYFRFFIILLFATFVFQLIFSRGKIVLLNGNSSVGKSSTAREFAKIAKGSWEVIDPDYLSDDDSIMIRTKTFMILFIQEILKRRLSEKEKSKILSKGCEELDEENFGLSVMEWEKIKSYGFKSIVFDYAVKLAYEKAICLSKQGKNIIISTVFAYSKDLNIRKRLSEFKNMKNVFLVLIYCPILLVSQRVNFRNELAIKPEATKQQREDFRPIIDVLYQFSSFYRSSNKNNLVLDTIFYKEVSGILNKIKKDFEKTEKQKQYLKFCSEKIFSNLGFTKDNCLFIKISPMYFYDHIINSGNKSIQECVMDLEKYISSKSRGLALKRNWRISKR